MNFDTTDQTSSPTQISPRQGFDQPENFNIDTYLNENNISMENYQMMISNQSNIRNPHQRQLSTIDVSRLQSLPKIAVTQKQEKRPGSQTTKLKEMRNKFVAMMPTNHVKRNIANALCNTIDDPTCNYQKQIKDNGGYIAYKMPDQMDIQQKQLKTERQRIKNVIGNNPFRVKNYVQGNDLNNDLIPLKLIRPKEPVFANDDEFIEHFLAQKRKEELKKIQRLGNGKKKYKIGGGLSSAYNGSIMSQGSQVQSIISQQSIKKQTFKTQFDRDVVTERSITDQNIHANHGKAKSSSPELEDPYGQTLISARQRAESELRRLSSGFDEGDETTEQREQSETNEDYSLDKLNVIRFQDDAIYGRFNRNEALRKHQNKFKKSQIKRFNINSPSQNLIQISSQNQLSPDEMNAQSLAQMNFLPLGIKQENNILHSPSDLLHQFQIPHQSLSQFKNNEISEGSTQQAYEYGQQLQNNFPIIPSGTFQQSRLSYLPSNIKNFLTRKQGGNEKNEVLIQIASQGLLTNADGSYIFPSQAQLQSTVSIDKDAVLQKKVRRNLVPGDSVPAPNSKAIQKLSQIINGARKLENHSLSLRNLATQLDSKLHQDRSSTNMLKIPSLLQNMAYFEKEFKLKKYHIEELYLQRKQQAEHMEAAIIQSQANLPQLGSMQQLNQNSNIQLSNMQSNMTSNPALLQPVNSSNNLQNTQITEEDEKDVIHVTLEGSSLQQLIKLIQEYKDQEFVSNQQALNTPMRLKQNIDLETESEPSKLSPMHSTKPTIGITSTSPTMAKIIEKELHHEEKNLSQVSENPYDESVHKSALSIAVGPSGINSLTLQHSPSREEYEEQQQDMSPRPVGASLQNRVIVLPISGNHSDEDDQQSEINVKLGGEQNTGTRSRKVEMVSPYMTSEEDDEEYYGLPRVKQIKPSDAGGCSKKEIFHFKKAMKKSNNYYRNLKVDENMKDFMKEKERQDKMIIDSEIYFRNQQNKNQQYKPPINPSEELLQEFSNIVLDSDTDLIKGRIRILLQGTELEEIAEDANIVISVQDDAKYMLKQMIVDKQRQLQKETLIMEREKLADLLNSKIQNVEGNLPMMPERQMQQLGELNAHKMQIFPRKGSVHLDEIQDIHIPMALVGSQSPITQGVNVVSDLESRKTNLDITKFMPHSDQFLSPQNVRKVVNSHQNSPIIVVKSPSVPHKRQDSYRSIAELLGEGQGTPEQDRENLMLSKLKSDQDFAIGDPQQNLKQKQN